MKRLLLFVIGELFDWFFAIVGVLGVLAVIALVGGHGVLAASAFVVFVALFIVAAFGSARILEKDTAKGGEDESESHASGTQ